LASEINRHHRAAETAIRAGLNHAQAAGRLLIEAKAQCPHGTWRQWLADNFEGSDRTARAYARIAKGWPEIEAKWQSSAILSIDGALKLLAAPRKRDDSHAQPGRPPIVEAFHQRHKRESQRLIWEMTLGRMLNWAEKRLERIPVHKLGRWLCPLQGFMTQQTQAELLAELVLHPEKPNQTRIDAFGRDVSDYDLIVDTTKHYAKVPFLAVPGLDSRLAIISMCDVAKACTQYGLGLAPEDPWEHDLGCCAFEGCKSWQPECLFGLVDEEPREFTQDELCAWWREVTCKMEAATKQEDAANARD
jgi:hypothetical protein